MSSVRRPSVCLSVTLVDCDHIGWNSSKIISPSVSLVVRSLQPKHRGSTPRGTPQNFRRNRGGMRKKWLSAYKSCNISEKRQDRTKVASKVGHVAYSQHDLVPKSMTLDDLEGS